MSLKTRILGLAATLIIVASAASWLAYRELSESIIERWGQQVAEIQVRYDSARLLQSLEREIGLAKQMASSSALINWAANPDDAALQAEAIRQMESFRSNFRDNNYFVALVQNGHYYYNNEENEYAGNQFRYVLDEEKPDDDLKCPVNSGSCSHNIRSLYKKTLYLHMLLCQQWNQLFLAFEVRLNEK